ncbi:hypothetical protein I4U23_030570 [Adineta vaga]|nr:hypothetical protein I4U23_030570 [Adineta vaga]
MNHPRKTTKRKPSRSSTSSTDNNNLWQIIDQQIHSASQSSSSSSSSSSIRRPTYPNVPKRTQRMPSINEHDTIQTESRITVIPTNRPSEKLNGYALTTDQNTHTRLNLNLITKYTSPQKRFERSLSPTENEINTSNTHELLYTTKSKRNLSPLNETIHESKRTKSFDEDEDELSQLLDHRRLKQILSQPTINNDNDDDVEEIRPSIRKPTVRKLNNTQQRILNNNIQTQPVMKTPCLSSETLIIEPDFDTEEDNLIDQEEPMTSHRSSSKLEDLLNRSIPNDVNLLDSLNSSSKQTSMTKDYHSIGSPLYNILKQPIDHSSPYSIGIDERQSTTSSTSLFYDTPRSSLSRTTTSNTNSTPSIIIKHDRETQISIPSKIEMFNELIRQTNLNLIQNPIEIDYNPIELAKKLFHQCKSFSPVNKYPTISVLIKKQFLYFGRYEIEVEHSINNDKISTIYACDLCLKHFYGSSIAYQRHVSKCFTIRPPGKLVYQQDDLAIFEIGETIMNMKQRLYVKSLYRITRLFLDSNKTIDDGNIDQFTYYILCQRDPRLSQSQSSFYRFIGYFSKKHNQSGQTLVNNLSCLSILPPFIRYSKYNQFLIAFSYSLLRSTISSSQLYSTPARPIDNSLLIYFRIYWRDMIFAYLNNQKSSTSMQSITLDTLAREIFIHPRDILSSLYFNNLIITHSSDRSSISIRNNSSKSVPCFDQYSLMNTNLIVTNAKKSILNEKHNMNKGHDNSIDEIVLD